MPSFLFLIYQLNSEHPKENFQVQGDGTASKQKKPGSLNNPITALPIQVGLMQEINFILLRHQELGLFVTAER